MHNAGYDLDRFSSAKSANDTSGDHDHHTHLRITVFWAIPNSSNSDDSESFTSSSCWPFLRLWPPLTAFVCVTRASNSRRFFILFGGLKSTFIGIESSAGICSSKTDDSPNCRAKQLASLHPNCTSRI